MMFTVKDDILLFLVHIGVSVPTDRIFDQQFSAVANDGQHIPWAGSVILRIGRQAKAHPHITTVLKVSSSKTLIVPRHKLNVEYLLQLSGSAPAVLFTMAHMTVIVAFSRIDSRPYKGVPAAI